MINENNPQCVICDKSIELIDTGVNALVNGIRTGAHFKCMEQKYQKEGEFALSYNGKIFYRLVSKENEKGSCRRISY